MRRVIYLLVVLALLHPAFAFDDPATALAKLDYRLKSRHAVQHHLGHLRRLGSDGDGHSACPTTMPHICVDHEATWCISSPPPGHCSCGNGKGGRCGESCPVGYSCGYGQWCVVDATACPTEGPWVSPANAPTKAPDGKKDGDKDGEDEITEEDDSCMKFVGHRSKECHGICTCDEEVMCADGDELIAGKGSGGGGHYNHQIPGCHRNERGGYEQYTCRTCVHDPGGTAAMIMFIVLAGGVSRMMIGLLLLHSYDPHKLRPPLWGKILFPVGCIYYYDGGDSCITALLAMSFQCVFTLFCWNPYRRDPPGTEGRGMVRRGLGDRNVVSPIDAVHGAVPPHLRPSQISARNTFVFPDRARCIAHSHGTVRDAHSPAECSAIR